MLRYSFCIHCKRVNVVARFQEPDAIKPLESFTTSYQGFTAAALAPRAMVARDTAQLQICTL